MLTQTETLWLSACWLATGGPKDGPTPGTGDASRRAWPMSRYASVLVHEGAALGFVQQQLGHLQASTTERFYADDAEAPLPPFLQTR